MAVISRIFDLLTRSQQLFKKEDMVAGKIDGTWISYSTDNFVDITNRLSCGLLASGIRPGDKVAIMSPNRPEWNICDFGIMQIGAIQVPMYPSLPEGDIGFILKDAEVKLIFVAGHNLAEKIYKIKDELAHNLVVYSFDPLDSVPHWRKLVELGERSSDIDIAECRSKISSEDLLTLIYTSGTTGTPKGVMLTHGNLLSNVIDSSTLYPVGFRKALSFLPLCHIFERMVVYMYFYLGISVYYAESLDTIIADINDVKPHGFTTVPRLLEKVYDKIVSKGAGLTGIKKRLFFWALALGLRYELNNVNGWWYKQQLFIANIMIFKKWRAALGGNIIAIVSGGAALQPRLARVFWAARIPVMEGYGLTETSPVIAVNGLESGLIKFGTVGKPLKSVEVKIADDGEILAKGPNIMKGYYRRPELTAEVIDQNGFFHTGDIGELTTDGFLRITDRKKEIFKTAGGKYIAPQVLENKYKESAFIEQVIVVGENRRFPAALIVPAYDALAEWCTKRDIDCKTREQMLNNNQVKEMYQREIDHYNEGFGKWERVKKFHLLVKEWSIDGGEMTPKLSLKRKVILDRNCEVIERLYENSEHIEIPG